MNAPPPVPATTTSTTPPTARENGFDNVNGRRRGRGGRGGARTEGAEDGVSRDQESGEGEGWGLGEEKEEEEKEENGGTAEEEAGGDGGGDGCLRYYRGSTEFPALSVRVENVFCLGSPIGMFLMIRGQHRRLGKAFKLPG